MRRLLGFSTRYELDGFLKAHGAWADVIIEDLRRDVQDLQDEAERVKIVLSNLRLRTELAWNSIFGRSVIENHEPGDKPISHSPLAAQIHP
jgi:hypothetical protein